MIESGVEVEVFPLVFEKNAFSFSKFYSAFMSSELDEINYSQLEPAWKLEDLNVRINKKMSKKKPLMRIDLCIDGVNKVGVRMFSLFKKFKKPTTITTNDSRTCLRRIVKTKCVDTDEVVQQEQVQTCFHLGSDKVKLNEDEVARIKAAVDISLTLVGFKPLKALKTYHNLRESIFIVSDDQRIKNSSIFFDALIAQLIVKEQVAIVKFRLSKSSSMRFGALMPQAEKNDKESSFTPNGFHLIVLPFANEIRHIEYESSESSAPFSDKEREASRKLVDELTVDDFNPRSFENPSIQRFYHVLQALTLNEDRVETFEDLLEPDLEGLESKIEVLRNFNQVFFESPIEPNERPTRKRNRNSNDTGVNEPSNLNKRVKRNNINQ
jgi:ATP-dependent DNA helicase 2 subunit 1